VTPVRYAPASCLAAASLHIHVQSFGRFDEITCLVEKTSDLTLSDLGRGRASIRCDIILSQNAASERVGHIASQS
jgi:hypothetical protein